MKRSTVIVVLIIAIALYSLISALLGDLLVGDVQTFLHDQFGDNDKKVIWGVAIVVLIIGAAISVYYFLNQGKEGTAKQKKEALQIDVLEDVRNGLEESYQSRIDSKLARRFPINIQLGYSKEGSSTREDLINQGVRAYGASTIKEELIKIFDQQAGRLLIVGEPGAGKTTIMLQLALKLLERNETQIPIVINIATWRDRFKNVEEWFEELLPQMGFSKNLVKVMTEKNRILPLFDGLDELVEESREGCLAAIAYYGRRHSVRYVICSRIEEYAATADAPVYVQVMVNPLTLEQIKKGLTDHLSPETDGILDAIDKDPLFAEAIEVPFYLNTVQLLFSSMKGVGEFGFVAKDVDGRRREIVEAFVGEATEGLEGYSAEDATRWLGFLADRMGRRGMVRFELVDMQYDWGRFERIGKSTKLILGSLVGGLVMTLTGAILGGILGTIIGSVSWAVFVGLTGGVVYGILGGQIGGGVNIEVKEKTQWELSTYLLHVRESLFIGFFFGFIGLSLEGFNFALFSMFAVCSVFGFINIITEEFNTYLIIIRPYQRFYGSMKSLYFSLLQHWHLCYLLRKKGLIARRYPSFLKAATKHNILISNGGSWRFRHRILQEHFSGVWWTEGYWKVKSLVDGYESKN